jgi:uncharacterized phage protein gp47/JayE
MASIQYGVTDKGFVRKPLSAIIDSLNSKFTGEFGSTFDISPESPDGQVIGIVADEVDSCWNQAELVFNAYRPGAMQGVGLDNICELSNTTRYVNEPTAVTVLCAGASGTVVPAGSIVTDGTMKFTTQTDVEIPGDVTVKANTPGAYYVAPNTINKIDPASAISGWDSVNNPDEGQTGITYEEDPALRARRDKTTAVSGSATVEAIYAALADLNLNYIRIRDNDTGAAIGSQPAGTVYVVIEGGTKNDIARRIYGAKTGGVPTFGTESITIKDSKGYPHTVKFSRPTGQEIFVKGTFKRRAGSNVSSNDTTLTLQQAAVDYLNSLQPGDPVVWSYLFGPLMSAVNGVEIDSLYIGTAANPTGNTTIEIDIDKQAHGTLANMVFTDVTTTP